ncbi:MAG: mechanosensitive ion channel [Alphaproteobacteria bacterium]|nr:mechanosensitive ion channel [Alphaproteobacteria bacterium]MDX5369381.1 mechanosensitive ion channel [Alphaproteobacteria bacterium]MDX5464062.1 mechanosensitive ion channel [Alphaproteobacteria bacterium]
MDSITNALNLQEMEALTARLVEMGVQYGLSIVGAILILIGGWIISGWAKRGFERALARAGLDQTIRPVLGSVVRYGILLVTLVVVLNQFGVQTASLIAVLGAAGLAIGLALQGTLSNVAAGVMLLILRPIKVGEFVEAAGTSGTVKSIDLFTTELATADNVYISVPNSAIFGQVITNYSRNPTRRLDLTLSIDYEDDMDKAIALARDVLEGDPRILAEPAPTVAVKALGASSVDIAVRGFATTADYWGAYFDITKRLKERCDAAGISIPFPQQVLTVRGGRMPEPEATSS